MHKEWPFCHREVHLLGGAVAINEAESKEVTIWPSTMERKIAVIKIDEYWKLYEGIMKYGFGIVGVEFITHASECNGESPPQWRSFSKNGKIWENWNVSQSWSMISSEAHKAKNGLAYDLSNRISYQLNSVSQSLQDLSISYRNQLNASVVKEKFEYQGRFKDMFTEIVYRKFHSFLFDACILRDYLCEFMYYFSENGERVKPDLHITTAGKYFKLLKKYDYLNSLEKEVLDAMSGGWIFELGAYRDLVMHSAPISIASHQLFCIQEQNVMPEEKHVQLIRFPIPSNPDELYKVRVQKDNFDRYIEQFEVLAKMAVEDYGKYDCLEYSTGVVEKLSKLAGKIVKISPVKPRIKTFVDGVNCNVTTS